MQASPDALYRTWTEQLDRWFATPGTLLMTAKVNSVFFWEACHEGNRYPHYGRFLRLEPGRLVELTWLTGQTGTKGAETVLTVEFIPGGTGARLQLTHNGFQDQESRDAHEKAWPEVLAHLDEKLRNDHSSRSHDKSHYYTDKELRDIADSLESAVTLPVNMEIEVEHRVYDMGEVEKILRESKNIYLQDCGCRTIHGNCDSPLQTCISVNVDSPPSGGPHDNPPRKITVRGSRCTSDEPRRRSSTHGIRDERRHEAILNLQLLHMLLPHPWRTPSRYSHTGPYLEAHRQG